MMIKGQSPENIARGNSLSEDGHKAIRREAGKQTTRGYELTDFGGANLTN